MRVVTSLDEHVRRAHVADDAVRTHRQLHPVPGDAARPGHDRARRSRAWSGSRSGSASGSSRAGCLRAGGTSRVVPLATAAYAARGVPTGCSTPAAHRACRASRPGPGGRGVPTREGRRDEQGDRSKLHASIVVKNPDGSSFPAGTSSSPPPGGHLARDRAPRRRAVRGRPGRLLDLRPAARRAAAQAGSSVRTTALRVSPAAASIFRSARRSYGVSPLFTIASRAPAASASSGRPATG